jgi:hypothetical protein
MASDAMVPGQFYPAQFDLSTAADQMRAMREQASATAGQVKRAAAGLKQGMSDAMAPVTGVSALSLQQQEQARRLAQQTMGTQQQMSDSAAAQWQMVMSPVSGGFENVTRAALAGTGHVRQAWHAMGRDMVASLVRSHAEALLMGGEQGSLLGGIFGSRQQGGGLSGLAGSLLFGQSYDAGVVGRTLGLGSPLAGQGLLSPLAAMAGAGGGPQAEMLSAGFAPGDALSAALSPQGITGAPAYGPLLGGGLPGAGVMDGQAGLSSLPQNLTQLGDAVRGLPETFGQLAQSASGLPGALSGLTDSLGGFAGGVGGGGGGLGGLGSIFSGALSVGSLFGFERGGIVPSAAGGMIVGPGHGTLAMLHPREMVLPAHISGGLQRMVSGGTGPTASHNVNVNYHVNALDAKSVRSLLQEHGDTIANVLQRQLRNSPRGGSGFQIS